MISSGTHGPVEESSDGSFESWNNPGQGVRKTRSLMTWEPRSMSRCGLGNMGETVGQVLPLPES